MSKVISDPHEALILASKIMHQTVPTAVCELQDYNHQIGCGDMDAWGHIQDVKLRKNDWDEEAFQHAAQVLATKLKTGGSTAA